MKFFTSNTPPSTVMPTSLLNGGRSDRNDNWIRSCLFAAATSFVLRTTPLAGKYLANC